MSRDPEAGEGGSEGAAERVVVEFRVHRDGDYEEWVADELAGDTYRGYLRRTLAGPVAPGDETEEFVSRGCGRPLDVTLRVVAVEGGTTVEGGTEILFRPSDG